MIKSPFSLLVAWAIAFAVVPTAGAQSYPSKPVRVIVPSAPGGGLDATARLLAKALSESLGQPFVVENRPGANGIIGTAEALTHPADGYTLLAPSSGYASNAALEKNLPYHPTNDLTPVLIYGDLPLVLVINSKVPAKSPQELLQFIRNNPAAATFGSGESSVALSADMLSRAMKASITTVPYAGAAKANSDLMGGHIMATLTSLATANAGISSGNLRLIAVSSKNRSPFAPDLPTLDETIAPGYDVTVWYSFMARTGTPKEVLTILNRALGAALQTPAVAEAFKKLQITPVAESLDRANERMTRELTKWRAAADAATLAPR